ncbi:Nucleolar protein of 40 kDa [Rhizophlyctis rosea]|uniref:Nucleolar protein of 40 kDa n=1 Tax=Rhizophlyctis rosea TaxID=64517 RepID=A0AAD5X1E6_9FUNG|nr:Nucleolar protein of 40 kDa [Rhizophlyctis rosea]
MHPDRQRQLDRRRDEDHGDHSPSRRRRYSHDGSTRDYDQSSHAGGSHRGRHQKEAPPLGSIHQGKVERVESYGAFISLDAAGYRNGLVHISQISQYHVKEASDVLEVGEHIWVKVIEISPEGKVSLSMKFVDQSRGQDLDPNNVKLELERKARASGEPVRKKHKLGTEDAILNVKCLRCGGTGHIPSDCRVPLSSKKSATTSYDILEDDPELDGALELQRNKAEKGSESSNLDSALEVLRKARKDKKDGKKKKKKDKDKKKAKHKLRDRSRERHGDRGRSRSRSRDRHGDTNRKRRRSFSGSSGSGSD